MRKKDWFDRVMDAAAVLAFIVVVFFAAFAYQYTVPWLILIAGVEITSGWLEKRNKRLHWVAWVVLCVILFSTPILVMKQMDWIKYPYHQDYQDDYRSGYGPSRYD